MATKTVLNPLTGELQIITDEANIANVPAGGIAAVDVQSAINELDTEKYAKVGGTLTGDVNVSKVSPEVKLTETGDGSTTRLKKIAASHLTTLYDKVIKAAGIGGAIVLDGINDYFQTTTGKSFASTESHTYIKWFYPTANHGNTTIAIGSGNVTRGTNFAFFFPAAGAHALNFYVANSGGSAYGRVSTFVLNTWNFIVATYNGANKELKYYHGTDIGGSVAQVGTTQTVAETWSGGTDPFFIGHSTNTVVGLTQYPAERVDECEVWDRVLTLAEIQFIFNGGTGRYGSQDANRVAGWHFDEGIGTNSVDYSGHGHGGNIVNGNTWGTGIVPVSAGIVEVLIMKSEDGIATNEEGKTYWGHCNGGTALRGKTIKKCISGVETDLTGVISNDIVTLPSPITPTGSPFTYRNTDATAMDIIVLGDNVTDIYFSRDGITYYFAGHQGEMFTLSPGDYAKVTYTVAPTITKIPR